MKKIIRKVLPKKLWQKLAFIKLVASGMKFYYYDLIRHSKYSSIFFQFDSQDKYDNLISVYTHILEKGIVMPNMRIGFGEIKVRGLIEICEDYAKKFDVENERFVHCVAVIKEYYEIHEKSNFQFNNEYKEVLNAFLSKYQNIIHTKQLNFTSKDYFEDSNSSFDKFSKSRHSVRNFSGRIDCENLNLAIELANTAPSACNRQSHMVYILSNKAKIQELLDIQIGAAGFAEMSEKFLIITYKLEFWKEFSSRNAGYFDSGLYVMNLLYALQFYKIAACPLNAYFSPKQDKAVRNILNIPDSENITCIIALGDLPPEFQVASSKRISSKENLKIID